MSDQYLNEMGLRAERPGSMPAGGAAWTAQSSGWLGGTPPLPQSLLWTVVGDLDVIDRLSRHSHQPLIPTWSCSSCGQAYPCRPAREDLLLDLGWIRVAIYSAVLMEHAAKDVRPLNPRELWQRFLEWTEPPEELRDPLLKRTA
jgi:hypothetical protein